MSFASVSFFLFLPVVFGLHWAWANRRWQNFVLLVASYVFYAWWDWRFCGLMLLTSTVDFAVGRGLAAASGFAARRTLLGVSLVINLGLLGFFKYFNFFADSLALALATVGVEASTSTLNIVLPVGISFYTFQSLSYSLDVYRRGIPPHRSALDYLTYVAFFPQLVAGPIERADRLLPQFSKRRVFSEPAAVEGCRLMLWGLAKKMLLADNLGPVADGIYTRADSASGLELMLGTLAFAFQIYADFSAYSDIAAGVGRLFGISLSRNFITPYFARSPAEFWRRWHVTLSAWLRDYVFIPLGGSRGTLAQTIRNILLTLLISGLWHGAAWHFVVWGGLHGIGLSAVHLWRAAKTRFSPAAVQARLQSEPSTQGGRLIAVCQMGATFAFVCLGWVFFRARDLTEAATICSRMAGSWLDLSWILNLPVVFRANADWLALVAFFVAVEWLGRRRWDPFAWERLPRVWRWAGYTAVVWTVVFLGTRRSAEFIYFQF